MLLLNKPKPIGEGHKSFSNSKTAFDKEYSTSLFLKKSLVPVDGRYIEDISLKSKSNEPSEEYYKWQFIYALIDSGLYAKDYIGVEVQFPKGNKNSAPIKIDACIWDSRDWIDYYVKWRQNKDNTAVEWLRKHLITTIEFKKSDDKDIKTVFSSQVKPELKESESAYCLAFYYNTERLYIFQKKNGNIIRYDETKNKKKDLSSIEDLSLDLTDGYIFIPSFDDLLKRVNKINAVDRSKRLVDDLDVITGVHSLQINNAISNILRAMDKVNLVNERGYEILIHLLAMKIFDEKRSEEFEKLLKFYTTEEEARKVKELGKARLMFYIDTKEKEYVRLSDENIQEFIDRMKKLFEDASTKYELLSNTDVIKWVNENHIKVISSIVENLQDYSFIRSYKTDLYQLVFYRFANEFAKSEKSQFITPLQIIEFLVDIVNPRNGETIIDPTCGVADFLSLSYINSNGTLDDKNIYGVDIDEDMVMLAKINMLLNGDGNAVIKQAPSSDGSILYKFNTKQELIELDLKTNVNGEWDRRADETKLMKFDVVLTNPPFGEDRKWEPKNDIERQIAETYELWNIARTSNWIDLGLIFLENAYRISKPEGGRIGIVLSNSIASVDRWEKAREWLLSKMRIVALFDLPPNVFADSGVSTTLVIAYRPSDKDLERLQKENYEVFIKDIKNIGYEVRTLKRVKFYNPIYKHNPSNFEVEIDNQGNPILDEEFTETTKEFRDWAMRQEKALKDLFIG